MKKLLVLMLVASLCALANGAIMVLQISAGGNPEPVDSEIVLLPSESIMLDVWTPNGYNPGDDEYWGLVISDASPGSATIAGGVVHIGPAPDLSWMLNPDQYDPFFPGHGGAYGQIMSSTNVAGPGVYFDEIRFHCDGPGDVILQLYSSQEEGVFVLEDTVIIHQIPEPATIALLSLGGLLLRKRK